MEKSSTHVTIPLPIVDNGRLKIIGLSDIVYPEEPE
jgi:hypothetical protein